MTLYEDKLRKMLDERKISVEQYEELRANLPGEGPGPFPDSESVPPPLPSPWSTPPAIPDTFLHGLVIANAVCLFVIAGFQLLALLSRSLGSEKTPQVLTSVLLNIGFGIGLLKMIRWVYILQIANMLFTLTVNLFAVQALGFVIHSILLMMLLAAWPAFFPGRTPREGWRDFIGELRRAEPVVKPKLRPAPVVMLGILLMISALISLTGPVIAHFIRISVAQMAESSSPLPLHIRLFHFVFHAYRTTTPFQGILSAAITLALRYGVMRLNRIAFLALGVVTSIGILVNLLHGEAFQIILLAIRGTLIIACWRIFFSEEENPAGAPESGSNP